MRHRLLLAPFTLAAAVLASPALVAAPADARTKLDAIVDAASQPDAPGIVIAVFDRGQEIYRRERGLADLETRAPFTADTPVYIASLAKTMTSAAVLLLADEKRIALDDPITKHISGLPDFAAEITLLHLLNHTSGLPDYDDLLSEDQLRGATNERVLRALREAPAPQSAPGEKWSYCNAAYVLLATVVERVEGASLADVLERRFFKPLGMTSTVMDDGEGDQPAGASAYRNSDGAWTPAGRTNRIYGPGGVYSTLNDLVKWLGAFTQRKVLPNWAMELAVTPAQAGGARTPYSCGWQPEDIGGKGPMAKKEYVASFGTLGGYQCELVWFPADDLWYVAVSVGGAFVPPPPIAAAVIESRD